MNDLIEFMPGTQADGSPDQGSAPTEGFIVKSHLLATTLSKIDIEPKGAKSLRDVFEEMFCGAEEWAAKAKTISVTSVTQVREMKLAREMRLALREIRVNSDKARKKLKEDALRQGKAIDGIHNVLKALVEPIEEHLLELENFAERVAEKERNELMAARRETLEAYGVDPLGFAHLGEMSPETWESIKETAKLSHEKKIEDAKQAERVKAEAQRIAAEQAEFDRKEAARIEGERQVREAEQKAENERLQAEVKSKNEQIERERIEAEAAAKQLKDAAQAVLDAANAKAEEERLARVALEQEKRDREATELQIAKDAERMALEKAMRPEKERLISFVDVEMSALKNQLFAVPCATVQTRFIRDAMANKIDSIRIQFLAKLGTL